MNETQAQAPERAPLDLDGEAPGAQAPLALDGEAPAQYSFRYLFAQLKGYRPGLVRAHTAAILGAGASVPLPLLLPLLVDEVLLDQPSAIVPWIQSWTPEHWHGAALYVGVIFAAAVALRLFALGMGGVHARSFTTIAQDLIYRLRRQLLERLERVALSEYEVLGSGAIATRMVVDLQTINGFVARTVARLIVCVLMIIGTAAILLWLHWGLALFILCMNPIVIYFTILLGKRIKDLKRRENDAIELFQNVLGETLDSIHQIRAYNQERHYLLRAADGAQQIRNRATSFAWKSEFAAHASNTVFLLGFDMFRSVSMLMVVFSGLSIGEMMAVFGYLWFMIAPVQELLGVQYAYYAADAALGRLNGLLTLHQEPRFPNMQNPFRGVPTVPVTAEDVHFAFTPEAPVLRGLSLTVAAGERVVFVGASGGGKSTLMQVLLGLYPLEHGTVRYGGMDARDIGFDVVRSRVAIVLQHPSLFNDTVRGNLRMGREIPEGELWTALKIAQLDEAVRGFPQGLDTLLGNDGMRLSGGQRQRLAIARMALLRPQVIILDEATSMLDTLTERRLHEALFAHFEGCTMLIVAHRLSVVQHADRVYVLEDGRIAEQGGHQQLIDQDGLYAKLHTRQAH